MIIQSKEQWKLVLNKKLNEQLFYGIVNGFFWLKEFPELLDGVWKKLVEMFEPLGYKAIKRYPVIARWNPTTEFVMASIAACLM